MNAHLFYDPMAERGLLSRLLVIQTFAYNTARLHTGIYTSLKFIILVFIMNTQTMCLSALSQLPVSKSLPLPERYNPPIPVW